MEHPVAKLDHRFGGEILAKNTFPPHALVYHEKKPRVKSAQFSLHEVGAAPVAAREFSGFRTGAATRVQT